MTFQDHYTENGIRRSDFSSFVKVYITSPPLIREHLIGNSDISAMICIRSVINKTCSTKHEILPVISPRSNITSGGYKRVVGSVDNLIARPSAFQVCQEDLLGNFLTLMSAADLGAFATTDNVE